MTAYDITIKFLNDMRIEYNENIHEPNPTHPFKHKFVYVVGYKDSKTDIFGGISNSGLSFVFSLDGELLEIMPSGD